MQGKGSQSELWFVVIDITFYSRGCTIYKYIYIYTHIQGKGRGPEPLNFRAKVHNYANWGMLFLARWYRRVGYIHMYIFLIW